ncbi:hypothetical protein KPL74_09030 [Bacillus sp. NP157]|nr:hypothetical protein KPL74_09030 [Bacillus sp. NP157]
MWVSRSERVWRRRAEATGLLAAARAAEARFAAFDRAVCLLLDDPEGRRQLARLGITSRWCARSTRMGKTGADGLSVLEGIVLAGVCSSLLDDAPLVRWMSQARADALQALHAVASCAGSGD